MTSEITLPKENDMFASYSIIFCEIELVSFFFNLKALQKALSSVAFYQNENAT